MVTGHVFMAMSLDGFVAREDCSLDWLMKQKTDGDGDAYENFVASIDGLVMGSGSFRTVLGFGTWPYEKPVIVMSQSLAQDDIPVKLRNKVRLSRLEPKELLDSLAIEGWKRAYIDGGKIVQSFIKEALIDDMTVTIVPILIGTGRKLFGDSGRDIDLKLIDVKPLKSGLVSMHYKVL